MTETKDTETKDTETSHKPETAETIAEEFRDFVDRDRAARLTAALKADAADLIGEDARFLVDAYYQLQEFRKAVANQARSGAETNVLAWLKGNLATLESQTKTLLDHWSSSRLVGRWSKSLVGVGPVISAGLMAHIDIEKAPTAGAIWRFAGLDPTCEWLGKEGAAGVVKDALGRASGPLKEGDIETVALACNRRADTFHRLMALPGKDGSAPPQTVAQLVKVASRKPWNHDLKVLCWKAGDCFVKLSGHKDCVYGRLYLERKAQEISRNAEGAFAGQAAVTLERTPKHAQAATYREGRLPDGRIDLRARRWAVKLFLSHWHHVAYVEHFGKEPPRPFSIEHLGHVGLVAIPNWPVVEG
jgi:hypothetical protein